MRTYFLLLLTMMSLAISNSFAQDSETESKSVEKIELLGGKVERATDQPDQPIVGVSFAGNSRFNDRYVRLFSGLKQLTSLDLSNTQITDLGLKELRKLTTLTSLNLKYTGVSDLGLCELAALSNLETLNLDSTKITDAGLIELRLLQNLTELELGRT